MLVAVECWSAYNPACFVDWLVSSVPCLAERHAKPILSTPLSNSTANTALAAE